VQFADGHPNDCATSNKAQKRCFCACGVIVCLYTTLRSRFWRPKVVLRHRQVHFKRTDQQAHPVTAELSPMGKQLYRPASKAFRALMSSWLTGSKPQARGKVGRSSRAGREREQRGRQALVSSRLAGPVAAQQQQQQQQQEAKNSSLEQVQSCMMLLWCCCGVYTAFEPFLHLCDG
jgi:hypothetical protein